MKIDLKIDGVDYICTPKKSKPKSKGVAIVDGHTSMKKGASSEWLNRSEYDFWCEFTAFSQFNDYFKFKHEPFIHEYLGGYEERQKVMAQRTKDFDLVIELHFNAFDGKANGSEALVNKDNELMVSVANKYGSLMSEFGFKDRGVKEIDLENNDQERGEVFISSMYGDAIILEPFFGDNKEDVAKFVNMGFGGYATVINNLVKYYYERKG